MPIRPATAADIPAIMVLASHAGAAAQWPRDQYARIFHPGQARRVALVLEEQELLAFLIARATDKEWELENIAVAASWRRQGLGSRLLKEFLDQARREPVESIFLEVRESNRSARALYEKSGFEESGRRRNYYQDPAEDAVIYRLNLS